MSGPQLRHDGLGPIQFDFIFLQLDYANILWFYDRILVVYMFIWYFNVLFFNMVALKIGETLVIFFHDILII
jgi:hypothetical protein